MISKVHFKSESDRWQTPQEFWEMLDREFHFDIDVAADAWTARLDEYYSPDNDGLLHEWRGSCWMNPPYGRTIGSWIRKAYESRGTATTVALIPARTDTLWWHHYVMRSNEIRLVRGRLAFLDADGYKRHPAPFPSAVVIWKQTRKTRTRSPVLTTMERN